jgi:hypothetical protein
MTHRSHASWWLFMILLCVPGIACRTGGETESRTCRITEVDDQLAKLEAIRYRFEQVQRRVEAIGIGLDHLRLAVTVDRSQRPGRSEIPGAETGDVGPAPSPDGASIVTYFGDGEITEYRGDGEIEEYRGDEDEFDPFNDGTTDTDMEGAALIVGPPVEVGATFAVP